MHTGDFLQVSTRAVSYTHLDVYKRQSQIKGDEAFKNKGIANATVALQGEVPGLTITRTSTRPGSEGA